MADFDEKAPEYDLWYQTKYGALVDELETACAVSLFKPEKEMLILDAGWGSRVIIMTEANSSIKSRALKLLIKSKLVKLIACVLLRAIIY